MEEVSPLILFVSSLFTLIAIIMYVKLCINVGKIKDDLNIISQYITSKAEKEGITIQRDELVE